MGFNDNNAMFTMPVAPTGYGYGNGGFGGFGGDGAWWLLVLLFAMGGWGNGWGANAGGGMPYVMNANTDNAVQRGFDQSAVMNSINNLTTVVGNGFADTQQAICNSTSGITGAINTGFASAEVSNNARQMANMQQMFGLQSQLSLATSGLNSTILSENCQDRYEAAQNTRDIINAINGGVQSLKDQMCQDKIDAKDDVIAQLRQQLAFSQFTASQNDQTAAIQAGQRNLANEVEQYVNPTARPAWIVQNPNCCPNNYGGCGCN